MQKLWNKIHPKKHVYTFSEGNLNDIYLLGHKGAVLCDMSTSLCLPVPPGFIISYEACNEKFNLKLDNASNRLIDSCRHGIQELEKITGQAFGGFRRQYVNTAQMPLLLSVRSSSSVSMPGMMDSILHVGVNDEIVEAMAAVSKNPRWAYDTYRRFIQNFGMVVHSIAANLYEDIVKNALNRHKHTHETAFTATELLELVHEFKIITPLPQDPWEQLYMSLESVHGSWMSPRAVKYRLLNGIDRNLSTAIVIQKMVYGNMNMLSGAGVLFTRDPNTGEQLHDQLYGEYLPKCVGLDVCSGVRDPGGIDDLRTEQPKNYEKLLIYRKLLEQRYTDMLRVEFVIENEVLYLLQSAPAKRTPVAAVRVAVDLVSERLLSERDALLRIDPAQMEYFQYPVIDNTIAPTSALTTGNDSSSSDSSFSSQIIGRGIAAAGGVATGVAVFTGADAQQCRSRGERSILCRREANSEDIIGMDAAAGILTLHGGSTCHATVIMRELGSAAVTSLQGMEIVTGDPSVGSGGGAMVSAESGDVVIQSGEVITIDGSTGLVYRGEVPTIPVGSDPHFRTLLTWAEKFKNTEIRAVSHSYTESLQAYELQGNGVGFFETSSMFSAPGCLEAFRLFLLSEEYSERVKYLGQLLQAHQSRFVEIFNTTHESSLTMCLLNKPLHTFLPYRDDPQYDADMLRLSVTLCIEVEECEARVAELGVQGLRNDRGSKVSLLYPDVITMQTMAFIGAAILSKVDGVVCSPRIAIPNISSDFETDIVTAAIQGGIAVACSNHRHAPSYVDCAVGAVLEVPRACFRADAIASLSDISFVVLDTDSLTECMFGMSRSDHSPITRAYYAQYLIATDPFQQVDREVVSLMEMAMHKIGLSAERKAKVQVHVVGSHCGNPPSVRTFQRMGVSSVSCAPHRIPTVMVAAAQGHIQQLRLKEAKHHQFHSHSPIQFQFPQPHKMTGQHSPLGL